MDERTDERTLAERRDEAVEELRATLRRTVALSEQTQREIEEANGFRSGYLSQVLSGHITLTARHVLGILMALDIPPTEVFDRILGADKPYPGPAALDELRERMGRYDEALRELVDKGVLDGPEPTPADDADKG